MSGDDAKALLVRFTATAPITASYEGALSLEALSSGRLFGREDRSSQSSLRGGTRRSNRRSTTRAAGSRGHNRSERGTELGRTRIDRTQRRRDRLSSRAGSRRERDQESPPPLGGAGGGPAPIGDDITISYTTSQPSTAVAITRYVPVQGYSNGFGDGSAKGHWDETIFGSELMTPRLNEGANNLSRISVGLLNDLGYNVDYRGSLASASTDSAQRFNISINFNGTEAERQTFEGYFLEAASFWEGYIIGGAFNNGSTADLTIYTSMFYSESRVLGSAGPTLGYTNETHSAFQAIEGEVNLNSYYFTEDSLRDPTKSAAFIATVRHEIGHVLGLGTFWPSNTLYGIGETSDGFRFADYAYTGDNAVREYNTLISSSTYAAPGSLLVSGESVTAVMTTSTTEPQTTWFCGSCGGLHLSDDALAHAGIPELTLVSALTEVVLGGQASEALVEPSLSAESNNPTNIVDPVTGIEAEANFTLEPANNVLGELSLANSSPSTDVSPFAEGKQQLLMAEPSIHPGTLLTDSQPIESLTSGLSTNVNPEDSMNITQFNGDGML